MTKKKILVITPIKHLLNVYKILESIPHTEIIYLPNCKHHQLQNHKDSYAIFTNPNKSDIFLGRQTLSFFNQLRIICTASTGTVHIDKNFCLENKIKIISLTEERKVINKISSTAEHAFTLMLSSLRCIVTSNQSVKNNKWDYEEFIGRQINYLTIGIIGYGRLGNFFGQYCDAFGAKVIIYDPYKSVSHPRIEQVDSLEELAKSADVISLHVHVTNETSEMINNDFLNNCKETVLIVNTSRGEIINEFELVEFLDKNKKAKYATDVLSDEINGTHNNPIKNYFNKYPNQIIITPHIGGMTYEAQNAAFSHAAKLLKTNFIN